MCLRGKVERPNDRDREQKLRFISSQVANGSNGKDASGIELVPSREELSWYKYGTNGAGTVLVQYL
jgi:hypothetical protein